MTSDLKNKNHHPLGLDNTGIVQAMCRISRACTDDNGYGIHIHFYSVALSADSGISKTSIASI